MALPFFTRLARSVAVIGLVVVLFPLTSLAQSTGDGSIYSRFGVGELRTFSSSQSQALGGNGTATRSLNYVGFSNPALWSDQSLTRFSMSANYQETRAEDAEGLTSRTVGGNLNSVHFSFPIYERTLGFAVGFQPISRTNYRVRAPSGDPFSFGPAPDDTTSFATDFDGQGGLQEITGGLGYRINDALSVGASVDFIFGIIEESQRTTFTNPELESTNLTDRTRLSGVTSTLGALLSLDNVIRSDDNFSVGASFTLPTELSGSRTRTVETGVVEDTLGTPTDGSVDLPWRAKAGITYQPDDRWIFTLDGSFEPWSDLSTTFTGSGSGSGSSFPVGGEESLTDRWRVSGGAEILPAGDSPGGEPFLRRVAYRLGGYAEQTYVQPSNADPINVLAATGGLSIPTGAAGTRIDLNMEVGTRGTTDANLVRDLFYSITIGVNIGERWFQERLLR